MNKWIKNNTTDPETRTKRSNPSLHPIEIHPASLLYYAKPAAFNSLCFKTQCPKRYVYKWHGLIYKKYIYARIFVYKNWIRLTQGINKNRFFTFKIKKIHWLGGREIGRHTFMFLFRLSAPGCPGRVKHTHSGEQHWPLLPASLYIISCVLLFWNRKKWNL